MCVTFITTVWLIDKSALAWVACYRSIGHNPSDYYLMYEQSENVNVLPSNLFGDNFSAIHGKLKNNSNLSHTLKMGTNDGYTDNRWIGFSSKYFFSFLHFPTHSIIKVCTLSSKEIASRLCRFVREFTRGRKKKLSQTLNTIQIIIIIVASVKLLCLYAQWFHYNTTQPM